MMRVMLLSARRVLFYFAMFAMVSGCATVWPYSAPSITAKVVDSADEHPLQGVMVVAYWRTITNGVQIGIYMDGGGPQPTCVLLANLLSASTGTDGTFVIPAWGPRRGCMTMYGSQPELLLYKPGYAMLRLLNADTDFDPSTQPYYESNGNGTVVTRSTSRWNGAVIKLVSLKNVKPKNGYDAETNNLFDYIAALDAATMGQLHPTKCYWDEARPAYLLAMQEERTLSEWYDILRRNSLWYSVHSPGPYYRYPMQEQGRLTGVEDALRMAYAPHFYVNGDFTCGDTGPYLSGLEKEADHIPVPGATTVEEAPTVQCQPGKPGCEPGDMPLDEWCKQDPGDCSAFKAHKAQMFNPAQCIAGPAACNRARLESQLDDRIQSICAQKGANQDRCDTLRALRDKLKAEDRISTGSQGGKRSGGGKS